MLPMASRILRALADSISIDSSDRGVTRNHPLILLENLVPDGFLIDSRGLAWSRKSVVLDEVYLEVSSIHPIVSAPKHNRFR